MNKKGITLVALVITVIVLLILAGVVISIGVGSNGLFEKTNSAVEGWNAKATEENVTISNALAILNQISGDNPPSTLPVGWNEEAVADAVTETSTIAGVNKERIVPIPSGFVASNYQGTGDEHTGREDQVASGLVIYQLDKTSTIEDVASITEITTENHTLALTNLNQYVWIPVDDINSMIMCQSNAKLPENGEDIAKVCNIELENGVLKCTNPAHESTSTALCGRLYYETEFSSNNISGKTEYTKAPKFELRDQVYSLNITNNYREPSVVTNKSSSDLNTILTGTSYDGVQTNHGFGTSNGTSASSKFLEDMETEFLKMAKSVYTYGGFYISRYEIGGSISNITSKMNQIVIRNTSAANNWYRMYAGLKGTVGGASSQMIWGCEYDQAMKFIGSSAYTGHRAWSLATTNTDNATKSGTHTDDIMNNIYDLEGNLREWTVEANGVEYRVCRGRYLVNTYYGNYYPATERRYEAPTNYNSPTDTAGDISSRRTLYVTI
ncbi:MAG: hypothetical protein IKP28_05745 [Clostridia bacterium]|nr:hypothetical protein [Clostridia bacterium]